MSSISYAPNETISATNIAYFITKRYYIKKIIWSHLVAFFFIALSGALQITAILTPDWYVLNVNEYIPTSKGGLWNYCFIGSPGHNSKYTCLRYEDLPNFALFINQRLHDSRILLVSSCGFTFFLICIEILSVVFMLTLNKDNDKFDIFVSNYRLPTPQLEAHRHSRKSLLDSSSSNLTRFTSSIIINGRSSALIATNKVDEQINELYNLISKKPDGYMVFLGSSLLNSIGGFMDFVLKISGFCMFDSYIKYILSYNTVFLAFRSFGYWFVVVSIILHFIYWIFKIISARYIVKLTKRIIESRENICTAISRARSKSVMAADTVKETKFNRVMKHTANVSGHPGQSHLKNLVSNENKFVLAKNDSINPKESPFIYNLVDDYENETITEEDLSSSSFSNNSSDYNLNEQFRTVEHTRRSDDFRETYSNSTNSTFISNDGAIYRF